MRLFPIALAVLFFALDAGPLAAQTSPPESPRERISINNDWRFTKGDPSGNTIPLLYDVRPEITDDGDARPADAEPTEAVKVETTQQVLKPWILPTGNDFIKDPNDRHRRPEGHPGSDVAYVQPSFDDSSWERVDLPHDWAIEGPWLTEGPYGGPIHEYRKALF